MVEQFEKLVAEVLKIKVFFSTRLKKLTAIILLVSSRFKIRFYGVWLTRSDRSVSIWALWRWPLSAIRVMVSRQKARLEALSASAMIDYTFSPQLYWAGQAFTEELWWRVELGQLRTCSGKKPLGEKRSCISVHFCTTWKSVFAVQEEQAKWPPIICSWVALLHAPHAPYTRSSSSSPCINYVKDYSAAADDSWHHLLLLLFMHSQEDQLDPDTPPPIADTLCWRFFGSINWVLIKIHHYNVPPSAYLLKLTSEFQIVSFLAPMIFQLIC